MKRIISLVLSLMIFCLTLVSLSIPSTAYESADGLWTYSLNGGKAVLSKYHGQLNKVTIPAKVDGYDVVFDNYFTISAKEVTLAEGITEVSDGAFNYNQSLEVINLPSTITYIGVGSFSRTHIKTISFPENLKTIGSGAFSGCDELKTVIDIPESVETLGDSAFRGAGITGINIPGTITVIPDFLCAECPNLRVVRLAEGVKRIGSRSFENCYLWNDDEGHYESIEKVYMPKSLISVSSSGIGNVGVNPFSSYYEQSLVVYGYEGTVAESFAETFNYKFVAIKPVTAVSVTPSSLTLASNKTSQLTCTVTPSDATNKNIKWSSSNNNVATVSSSGLVTSKSEGTAVITATSEDGGLKATCNVTVHNHSYTATVEKAATCSQEGIRRYTCKCGDTYTEPIGKTSHKYVGKITTPAGCTTSGVKTFTCSVCQAQYTESIKPTGHSMTSSITKSPTCTEKGTKHYWCTKCDYSYDEQIPANGHNMTSSVSKAATCTEDGTLHNYCTRCTYSYDTVIKAEGHKYGAWKTVTPPTKTKEGTEKRTCSVCQASQTRAIPAEGKLSSANVKINNNPGKKTINYREGIILTAKVSGQNSGDKVVWYVNNQKYCEGNTFEYKEIKTNITVKAVLVDKSGTEYYNSEEKPVADDERIEVKADFFTKLIAFFKGIFGGNPIIKQ